MRNICSWSMEMQRKFRYSEQMEMMETHAQHQVRVLSILFLCNQEMLQYSLQKLCFYFFHSGPFPSCTQIRKEYEFGLMQNELEGLKARCRGWMSNSPSLTFSFKLIHFSYLKKVCPDVKYSTILKSLHLDKWGPGRQIFIAVSCTYGSLTFHCNVFKQCPFRPDLKSCEHAGAVANSKPLARGHQHFLEARKNPFLVVRKDHRV